MALNIIIIKFTIIVIILIIYDYLQVCTSFTSAIKIYL